MCTSRYSFSAYYGLNVVSLQNSHADILTTDIILGDGAFWRQVGYENGDFMNDINVLIKGTSESFLFLFISDKDTRS